MHREVVGLIAVLGMAMLLPSWGQERRDALESLQLERDQQRRDRLNRPVPLAAQAQALVWLDPVAGETPCFVISRFEVSHDAPAQALPAAAHGDAAGTELAPHTSFAWLARELGAFETACLGVQSVDALRRNLDARLAQAGFVTSSVSVPAQNLGSGVLRLMVQTGRIGRVVRRDARASTPSAIASNALPFSPGDVLNLRAVEHSLENLARLPSQAANFQIQAGDQPGESVLFITSAGARPWQADLTLDNAAPEEYGRWQWQAQAAVDGPLGWSDQASIQLSQTLRDTTRRGMQRSAGLSYSLPLGYALFSANVSRSENRRTIQGTTVRFVENGYDRSSQLRAQWTFWRSAAARAALWGSVTGRRAQTFIEDTELVLQRRKSVRRELGVAVSGQLDNNGAWSIELDRNQGRKLQVAPEFGLDAPEPSRQSQVRLSLSAPWEVAGMKTLYVGQAQAQYVRGATSGGDLATVGSRYSVRGFDGQDLLQAPAALTLKNELRLPPWQWFGNAMQAQPFVAVDAAQIFRPRSRGEEAPPPDGEAVSRRGSSLLGMALGARWRQAQFFGDVTVGWPLHKPSGSTTPRQTVVYATFGFQL